MRYIDLITIRDSIETFARSGDIYTKLLTLTRAITYESSHQIKEPPSILLIGAYFSNPCLLNEVISNFLVLLPADSIMTRAAAKIALTKKAIEL